MINQDESDSVIKKIQHFKPVGELNPNSRPNNQMNKLKDINTQTRKLITMKTNDR